MPAPTFFIDIDGVLYGGSAPVAEGPSVIEFLRQQGSGFLLVTNTTRMSQQEIQQKLTGLGYRVQDDEIYPVSLAAVDYINTRYGAARCFMIGDASLETLFAERGHTVVRTEEPVAAVIMGLTLWPHFGEIDIARRLVNAGAEPIALHADPTWPDEGVTRIGLGSMVAALEVVISRPITDRQTTAAFLHCSTGAGGIRTRKHHHDWRQPELRHRRSNRCRPQEPAGAHRQQCCRTAAHEL